MSGSAIDLEALSSKRTVRSGPEVHPPRRWFSRWVLPLALLAGFGGLAVYAAWEQLIPAAPVTTTPVIVERGFVDQGGTELVKAVGWVEPNPAPIEVGALVEGVVARLPVRLGQRLEPGDLVAELVNEDARLALQTAEAELEEQRLKAASAASDVAEAIAQYQLAETVERVEYQLLKERTISENRYAQAKAQLAVAQARVGQAQARQREALARVRIAELACAQARLRLDRTVVRSAYAGIIMKLHTVPGRMVGLKSVSAEHFESLVELYDPARLQVRVEVPLDKFRHVQPLQPAVIEVDALPGKRLPGVVLYDTHQADITRNTVQVKVGLVRFDGPDMAAVSSMVCGSMSGIKPIEHAVCAALLAAAGQCHKPQEVLRPGMIASVRIFSPLREASATLASGETLQIWVPRKLVLDEDGQAAVWVVDQAANRAVIRRITLGRDYSRGDADALVEVTAGLHPSDKLIVAGRENLRPGQRIRVTGEEP